MARRQTRGKSGWSSERKRSPCSGRVAGEREVAFVRAVALKIAGGDDLPVRLDRGRRSEGKPSGEGGQHLPAGAEARVKLSARRIASECKIEVAAGIAASDGDGVPVSLGHHRIGNVPGVGAEVGAYLPPGAEGRVEPLPPGV